MNNQVMFNVVKDDLAALEDELLSVIHSPVGLINTISEHLIKAGGKRLRPALYFICARSRCSDLTKMMPMAVAIELIHMATLVHDDVIDNASTRRGRLTANVRWGNHRSVLAGDYLFAKAFDKIAANVNGGMLRVLTDVICSLCEGEIIQHQDAYNPEQSEEGYLIRITKKTADFIGASCQLGGMTAGLADADVRALREYGNAVGMAFQITDDILDITASSEKIGKPAGNDLRQGIVTMPIIYALSNSGEREELQEIISKREMTDEEVKRGLDIVNATAAVEYSYRRVDEYLKYAREIIPSGIPVEIKESLIFIADFVGQREF